LQLRKQVMASGTAVVRGEAKGLFTSAPTTLSGWRPRLTNDHATNPTKSAKETTQLRERPSALERQPSYELRPIIEGTNIGMPTFAALVVRSPATTCEYGQSSSPGSRDLEASLHHR
jgi:hypothetical protein